MEKMKTLLPLMAAKAQARLATRGTERGDAIQWVLIAIMSAAIMVAILAIARPQLKAMFDAAMQQAQGATGN